MDDITAEEVRKEVNEEQRRNNEENARRSSENAGIESNLEQLRAIKSESDSKERKGKSMGFFKRIISFFKFNSRYKKGDMTTGGNKQRSDNGYENFLLAKLSFQSGGNSYQSQEGASITMSSAAPREADISPESLDRMKTDGGESVDEAAVSFIEYRKALRLLNPKATFKRGLFSSKATADYTSENAQLNFMGDFRSLSVDGGVFHLQHEYVSDTDKFGEIASMNFKYNNETNVKTGLFFVGDGAGDVTTNFSGTAVDITGRGFSMNMKNVMSEGRVVSASTAHIELPIGIFGKKSFDVSGNIALDDSGIIPETDPVPFDKKNVEEFNKLFQTESASAVLKKSEDGAPVMGVELGKWQFGFKKTPIELRKEGGATSAEFDAQGRLSVPCPGNLGYRLTLFGKKYLMDAVDADTSILLSDRSLEVVFQGQDIELFGKTFKDAVITAGMNADGENHLSVTAKEAVVQDSDEGKISLKDIEADISQSGIVVNNAEAEISGKIGEMEIEKLEGRVNELSLSKQGVEFQNLVLHGENIKSDAFSVDAATVVAARTAQEGFILFALFNNLNLDIEGGGGDDESEEEEDGIEYNIITEDLKGLLILENFTPSIETKGKLKVRVQDLLNFDAEDICYVDKTIKATNVFASLYGLEDGINFKDIVKASAIDFHGKNLEISRAGLLGKDGLLKVTLEELSVLDTELGDAELEITETGAKASISDIPENDIDLPFDGSLSFSGGIGISIESEGGNKKILPVLDSLKVDISYPGIELHAAKFTSTEDKPFRMASVSAMFPKLPGELGSMRVKARNLAIGADKRVTFSELSCTYQKMIDIIDGFLSVGKPKIGVLDGFTGFTVGGLVNISSEYFKGGVGVSAEFKKDNNFRPKINKLKNIEATIPKLATAKIKSIEIDDSSPDGKILKLNDLSLEGYKKDKDAGDEDNDTFFDKLCASVENLKVSLSEATYNTATKTFDYDKENLIFHGTKFSVKVTDDLSATLDVDKKSVTVEYGVKIPKDNFPKTSDVTAKNIPHQIELGAEITPIPFVGFGGDIFAGAFLKADATATLEADTKDKVIKTTGNIDAQAVAGIGLEAYLMLGMSKMFNVKAGLRGTLLGDIKGELEGGIGFTYGDNGLGISKEPDNTKFSFDFKTDLIAKIDAFVKAQLFGLINTDLYTFNLKTIDLASAQLSGNASYDSEGNWLFDKSFTFKSDFTKKAFDPNNKDSIVSCTKKTMNDITAIKSSLGEYERVYGLQDWGSEEAMLKSAKMQNEIFPMFKEIREKNDESFKQLEKADKNIMKSIEGNNVIIAKHQHRKLRQEDAEKGVSSEEASVLDSIFKKQIESKKEHYIISSNALLTLEPEEVSKLGALSPASIAGYMFRNYGVVFDGSDFRKITDKYYDVRRRIKQASERKAFGQQVDKSREVFMTDYSEFVGSKDKNIKKYLSDNSKKFDAVKKNNEKLRKKNEEINKVLGELGSNLGDLEQYNILKNKKDAGGELTKAETEKLNEYTEKLGKDLLKKYGQYKEKVEEKSKFIQMVTQAREALSSEDNERIMRELEEQNLDFGYKRSALGQLTGLIQDTRSTKIYEREEYDVSFLADDDYEPVSKGGYLYFDVRELKKLYPDLLSKCNDTVTKYDDFKRMCNAVLEKNMEENAEFIASQFNKKISSDSVALSERAPLDKKSQDKLESSYLTMLYSSRSMDNAKRMSKEDKTTGDERPTLLNNLQTYNQGRIDEYEGNNRLILETMDNLRDNIIDSNELFVKANRLFFKLDSITPNSLEIKDDEKSNMPIVPKEYDRSLTAIDEAETLLAPGSKQREKIGKLKTESEGISKDVANVMKINELADRQKNEETA
ncbi:MAG: hypothetical protein ACI4XA_10535 [Oscillospiraceae bacterium]